MHGSIDIHGAGDFDAMEISDSGIEQKVGHVHGVPHCVLSHATTSRLFENNVMAQSFEDLKRQNNVLQTFHTLTIKDPFRPCSSRLVSGPRSLVWFNHLQHTLFSHTPFSFLYTSLK